MAGNGSVRVPPDSTGKIVDGTSLSVGGVTVIRQRIVIGDPVASAGFAVVSAGRLQTFAVVAAGTAHIGEVNISVMPAVVLAAGAAHIGEVNISVFPALVAGSAHIGEVNISTMPAVALAAGAAHIGEVNISTMPAVALAAGAAHVGEVNISLMPAVVLAAGAAHVGEVNISLMPVVSVTGGVAISGTAVCVNSGVYDSSSGSTTTVRVGDSANSAIRVNVVAGGAGGGIVFGANQDGLSATAAPVLVGGRDSAGGGLVRTFLTDSSGRPFVNVNGTVTVTGTGLGVSGTVAVTGTGLGISGTVAIGAGAAHIGEVNISVFPALVAGTAHIGEVNISVMPAVVLAAGAAHIGEVNISVFPALAAGAAHIGEVNISLMPQVVLAAGTANIGAVSLGAQVAGGVSVTVASVVVLAGFGSKISAGATATATTAWVDPNGRAVTVLNHPSIVASATQGPQNKDITATAMTTLVASAGANCVYVTGILVTNGSTTMTGVAFCSSDQSAAPQVVAYIAANGGGFNKDFHPPWKLSAGTALQGRIFPTAALSVTSVISFYVGP